MEDVLLAVRLVMIFAFQLGVFGLAGVVLIVGLYEIVQNKIHKLRRQASLATSTAPLHS